jgi:hypothetical protein
MACSAFDEETKWSIDYQPQTSELFLAQMTSKSFIRLATNEIITKLFAEILNRLTLDFANIGPDKRFITWGANVNSMDIYLAPIANKKLKYANIRLGCKWKP